jgi:hypothetical protein
MRFSRVMEEKLGSSVMINGRHTLLTPELTRQHGVVVAEGRDINSDASVRPNPPPEHHLQVALFNDQETGREYVFNVTHWRPYQEFLSFLMDHGNRERTVLYQIPQSINTTSEQLTAH